MELDQNDPRPPYLQVASVLRAAILTKQFVPGDKLPAQSELATQFGVARMTVQQALRILKDEGLILSRPGSGMYVRVRTQKPVGLRPFLEKAFESPKVSIDFLGYTAETLHNALLEPLDKIRSGRLCPETLTLRLILADMSADLALPVAATRQPSESQGVRLRMNTISLRHVEEIEKSISELAELGLIKGAEIDVKRIATSPLSKTYIINDSDIFIGYYPVKKHTVKIDEHNVEIFDPMGKDVTMFHFQHDGDAESTESILVQETKDWFESLWTTIAVAE